MINSFGFSCIILLLFNTVALIFSIFTPVNQAVNNFLAESTAGMMSSYHHLVSQRAPFSANPGEADCASTSRARLAGR